MKITKTKRTCANQLCLKQLDTSRFALSNGLISSYCYLCRQKYYPQIAEAKRPTDTGLEWEDRVNITKFAKGILNRKKRRVRAGKFIARNYKEFAEIHDVVWRSNKQKSVKKQKQYPKRKSK